MQEFESTLGGWRILVRPAAATEEPQVAEILDQPGPPVRSTALARLGRRLRPRTSLRQVDPILTVVAIAVERPDAPVIAVARLGRDTRERELGETAVAVAAAYRRIGLGRLLAETIKLAALEHGIRQLRARVKPEDDLTVRVLVGLGARLGHAEGRMVVLTIPVVSPDRTLKSSLEFPAVRAGGGY